MHRSRSLPFISRSPRLGVVGLALLMVTVGTAACSQAADPPAPVGTVVAAPFDSAVSVNWTAPAAHADVTRYEAIAQPGSHSCSASGKLQCFIAGMTNGKTYRVAVRSVGSGGSSPQVWATVTVGAPWTPGLVTGVAGDTTVAVSWGAPLSPGQPITSYTVTATPGYARCTSVTTTCTVTGLTNDKGYTFVVTATNALATSQPSPPSALLTPSALSGGSAGIDYLGPVNANQETTTGTVLQRDAGISVALPNGRDLWIFGDTSSFSANASQSSAFIGGSTAAKGRYVPGRTPTALKDILPAASGSSSSSSSSAAKAPAQFIPTPSDTYMPDGSGRACTAANGAVYTARWPTGAALLDNQAQLFVTYTDVCVTSATTFTVEGWGWMIYAWHSSKIKIGPIDVFPPAANGAPLPNDRAYQSPIVSNGQLTLFTSVCDQLFIACTSGSVTATTLSDNPLVLGTPAAYVGKPAVADGSAPWRPVNVSVASYPSGLRLIEQTSIGGTFLVFSSPSPTGPWHPFLSGTLPGCSTTPRGFCYAFVGHPELGSNSALVLSYFKPDSPQNANVGHVDLASVPVPPGA